MLAALDGTGIGILYNHVNTPFIVTTAVGYEDYYAALLEDPDFIRECFKRVTRSAQTTGTDPDLSADAHLITAILAMSNGPIMSDAILEEFEFPCLERNVR